MFALDWTKPLHRDSVGDGWDPAAYYQMVPVLGKRSMRLSTGPYPVKVTVDSWLSCSLVNFVMRWPLGKVISEIPPPGRSVHEVTLPPNIEVDFEIQAGGVPGRGYITAQNLEPGVGRIQLVVSIKERQTKSFLVCYVADDVFRDFDQTYKGWIDPTFYKMNRTYLDQTNTIMLKTREEQLRLHGSIGYTFDFREKPLMRRWLTAAKRQFGSDVFSSHHAVIFIIPMPIRLFIDNRPRYPIGAAPAYTFEGKLHRCIFLPPLTGYAEQARAFRLTLPHEVGHSLGLEHVPEDYAAEFPPDMPKVEHEKKLNQDWLHNLMFPAALTFESLRLARNQIELVHRPNQRPVVVYDLNTD